MKESSKGFTLIDILLYAFLTVLTLSFLVGILMNFFLFRGIFTVREEVGENMVFFLEKIGRDIQGAESITSPLPGQSGTTLILKRGGEILSFGLKDNRIVKEIGGKEYFFTSDYLEVNNYI